MRRGVSDGLAGRVPTQWVAATQAPVIDAPQKHNLSGTSFAIICIAEGKIYNELRQA